MIEFDGEDACGSSSWDTQFVSPQEGGRGDVTIVNLKPYTQYAFLVRSYTISSTNYGAKSEIMYIRTQEEGECVWGGFVLQSLITSVDGALWRGKNVHDILLSFLNLFAHFLKTISYPLIWPPFDTGIT